MEVRDPIHGSITLEKEEISVVAHPFFQRLRHIRQLGLTESVFPGATHTRYLHSLGVMSLTSKVFDKIFSNYPKDKELLRIRETVRLAALLHDIGHAPLSHATESSMPPFSQLNLPKEFKIEDREKATHEDFTIKFLVEDTFQHAFRPVKEKYGVCPHAMAQIVMGKCLTPDFFLYKGTNLFPLLHQLVSSEMDCDRMDYLLRDSYFCGVSYGQFDLDWILNCLGIGIENNTAYLSLSEKAVSTFDDFLLGRFHMFLMVYFHYRPVCLEHFLTQFLIQSDEYKIPSSIEEYSGHDDHYLLSILKKSKNPYAQRIIKNQIPDKIFEAFNPASSVVLQDIEHFLKGENIDYIQCSSKNRLSKYYPKVDKKKFSLKVERPFGPQGKKYFTDIERATNLFHKYQEVHTVNRIYCDLDQIGSGKKKKLDQFLNSLQFIDNSPGI